MNAACMGITEEQSQDPFVSGMEKIYRQLMTTLEAMEVKPIEAVGQPFDPNFHNAVMHVEDESPWRKRGGRGAAEGLPVSRQCGTSQYGEGCQLILNNRKQVSRTFCCHK